MKDCPFDVCKLFRKKLDFKPFSCFFCLSFWIYCVTILLFYALAFVSIWIAKQISYVGAGLGIGLLLYLLLNNFFTQEYNNDVEEISEENNG